MIQTALRAEHLGQPEVVEAAYAAAVQSTVAVLRVLDAQVKTLQGQVESHFGRHPAAEIVLSQPGLGVDPGRPGAGRVRRCPRPLRLGQVPQELRRHQPDHPRLGQEEGRRWPGSCTTTGSIDALDAQAFAALSASPGARAYYDRIRARGIGHHAALRQLANRLVGILHGCLKTGTVYDETTAWPHLTQAAA